MSKYHTKVKIVLENIKTDSYNWISGIKINWYAITVKISLFSLLILALLSYSSDYKINNYSIDDLCFSSDCVDNFFNNFSGTVRILKEGGTIIAFMAALYGTVIALKHYLVSVKSSALSGHISHFELFQNYVETEAKKVGMNSFSSVNTFFWYRAMFPNSKSGDVSVSKQYKKLVMKIISEADILDSSLSKPGVENKHTYTTYDHQWRIINSLSNIGISLSKKDPSDFLASEVAAFRLVDSVNFTFYDVDSSNSTIPIVHKKRAYF